jgi:alpha-D-xyloside xylohydrolase
VKFNDGYWRLLPGVALSPAVQARDVRVAPRSVTLFLAPQRVVHRGQTLAGPLLEVVFTSPHEGVLQLTLTHYNAGDTSTRELEPLDVSREEGKLTISSGLLTAEVTLDPYSVSYHYAGRFLTAADPRQTAYITTPSGPYCRERLRVSVGENLYGFGERFTPFVKNGQSIDTWNEDGGTASEQAYKCVPFCVSSRGYGVYVDHTERVGFEVCSEAVSKLAFSVPGESLSYMLVGGENPKDVVSRYTAVTGRPALPPEWSFGLWLSTSFTTSYDEATVTSFIDGMRERDIPLSVFHFDCFWMKEYQWCDFEWDPGVFPDPAGMLARLKAGGLKICVWINPYIGQKSPLFAQAAGEGYLLKNPDGTPWQWDLWQPGMGIVDFTNPGAVKWYQSHLRRLLSQGVDCFKTDFGERIPLDCVYHSGADPQKMHNRYAFLYNAAVFELLEEVKGKGQAVVFARSASAGCQRFPVHWGGDCEATYESMAESLRGGLSLSLCGFGFWSHDIGGFEQTATPDLYKRWVAFGLLSSHSRLHGSTSYRVPWNFDEEAVDVLRFFAKLKQRLMPYILAAAREAHETGVPVMRPLLLEFPDDPVCAWLDRQYMLGPDVLVAPVFNPRGEGGAYLPAGRWVHLLTGEETEGGRFVSGVYDYFSLPLYARAGSAMLAL